MESKRIKIIFRFSIIAIFTFFLGVVSVNAEEAELIDNTNTLKNGTNSIVDGWRYINGEWFLYINGSLKKGWFLNEAGWHYFDDEGKMLIGWNIVNNHRYFFDTNGVITKGWKNINGWHYFDDEGKMVTGWYSINGKQYLFNENGVITTGWRNINGWRYFNAQGHMLKGWNTVNGKKYFFNENNGVISTGIKTIGGITYNFNSQGHLQTESRWKNINGKWYYFKEGGSAKVGWYKNYEGWHYFNEVGQMLTGKRTINNKKYIINERGIILTGWRNRGGWYHLNDQGHMSIGWDTINNKKYYFDSNGLMTIGWFADDSGLHYFNKEGHMLYGKQIIDGKTYYFNSDGSNISGWYYENNKKYLKNSYNQIVKGASKFVIDISKYNGVVDWNQVKDSGVDYVILQSSFGFTDDVNEQMDKMFIRNVKELNRLGMKYGVYHFSYAKTVEEAENEAIYTLNCLKAAGAKPSLPVYYDLEYTDYVGNISRNTYIKMAKVYCEKIKSAGLTPGIYANLYFWNNKLNDSSLDVYNKWVAQYGDDKLPIIGNCDYQGKLQMWQYTSSGRVPGIMGNVDLNAWFEY